MKAKRWLVGVLAIVMMFTVGMALTACDNGSTDIETVKVTFFDGRTELKSQDVAVGARVREWTPTKDGYTFRYWYADAAFSTKFDFSQKITKKTNIYAKFRSETPEEDSRMWYVIGTVDNWSFLTEKDEDTGVWSVSKAGNSYSKYFFTLGDDNTYTIDLAVTKAETKFQFITNISDPKTWEGDEGKERMGCGNLAGFEFAEGTNPEDGADYSVEDMMYGEVKDENGEVIFKGGKEYDMMSYCWNIWPQKLGIYRFTFKSYPGENSDNEIAWELLEEY